MIARELGEYTGIKSNNEWLSVPFTLLALGALRAKRLGSLILDLCGVLREYDSTDLRDKVYAIPSLASDFNIGDLVPDYSKPFEDVYMDLIYFSISKSTLEHKLDFLGFVVRIC
jgi:hypothetical protein